MLCFFVIAPCHFTIVVRVWMNGCEFPIPTTHTMFLPKTSSHKLGKEGFQNLNDKVYQSGLGSGTMDMPTQQLLATCTKSKFIDIFGLLIEDYNTYLACQPTLDICHMGIGEEAALRHCPHLLMWATSERFLPARGNFRAILTTKSHWLQPVLVLFVHW